VPGLGHQRIRNLVDTLGSPGRVIRADFRALCSVRGVGREIADGIKNRLDRSFAETQLKLAERKQVRILTYWDENIRRI